MADRRGRSKVKVAASKSPARGPDKVGSTTGKQQVPVKEFFSIGDVCELTGLKPHVLRYWESQFTVLNPAKNRSGNRVYQRREVELIMLVKQLLYDEKYTIDGARQKLIELRRDKSLRAEAASAYRSRTAAELEQELLGIIAILEDKVTPDS